MPGTFASLRVRNFRLFFVGTAVSLSGRYLIVIAQSLLVYDITRSGLAVGAVGAFAQVPVLFCSSWGGLIADRYDKRRALLAVLVATLAQSVALAVVVTFERPPVTVIFLFAALRGATASIEIPIRRSLAVEAVPRELVGNAIALDSAIAASSLVLGSALGGVLVGLLGYTLAFVTAAAMCLEATVSLWRMDPAKLRTVPPAPRARGQLRDSVTFLMATTEQRVPLLLCALTACAYNFPVFLLTLVSDSFGQPKEVFTYLYSALGVGSVTGALLIARRAEVGLAQLGPLAFGLGAATIALGLNPVFALAFPLAVAVGVAAMALMSGTLTVIQTHAVPAMRGRVVSFHSIASLGTMAVTAPLVGWLCDHRGPRTGITVVGSACIAAGAWAHYRSLTARRALLAET